MHNTRANSGAEPGGMQTHTSRLSRHGLEHLLDGHPVGPVGLNRLIAAARTTGVRADSAGLGGVLAEFTQLAAAPTVGVPAAKRSLLKVAATRIAAAKLFIVAAVAVVATGGVALAATGNLPSPLPGSTHATPITADTTTRPITGGSPKQTPTALTPTPGSGSRHLPTPSAPTSAPPSPSLTGLCKSWLARPHVNGKADDSAAFSALVAAAGGVDAVNGYCTALLGRPSSNAQTSIPPSTNAKIAPGQAKKATST
jgi:hypothetical protein